MSWFQLVPGVLGHLSSILVDAKPLIFTLNIAGGTSDKKNELDLLSLLRWFAERADDANEISGSTINWRERR